jgi:hypothetical protein
MATLTELVETVANVEGLDSASVRLIARLVREAGLVTTGGRGPSAGQMTVKDAANLLIAVNATGKVQEAAQTVRSFRRLYDVKAGRRYRFGDALEQLIQAIANKRPWEYLSVRGPPVFNEDYEQQIFIHIEFHRPNPQARIEVFTPEGTSNLFFRNKLWGEGRPKRLGDRDEIISIHKSTIRAIGELFYQ